MRTPLVAIDVRDTGQGVPEALHKTLFEPFVQADASISRRYGGSGLDLAITRRLAEAMGGTITLESRLGEGSCFTLLLPVQEGRFPIRESTNPTETYFVRQGRHMPDATMHIRNLEGENAHVPILAMTAFFRTFFQKLIVTWMLDSTCSQLYPEYMNECSYIQVKREDTFQAMLKEESA